MAFKNRLLATAAIPLVAMIGFGPVSAAEFARPAVPGEAQSLVVRVQATDDQEQLKKQQRQERRQQKQETQQDQNGEQQNQKRKNRQDQNAGQEQQQQDNGNRQRRNKQNNDASTQQQDDSQQMQQPRRKKQQQSDDSTVQTLDNGDQQQQVKPRRNKKSDNAETQQQNTDQGQQTEQEKVKPRRNKNDAETQQNADQGQQDDQQQVKPRRNKQNQNADTGQQNDNNASSDQGESTNDKLKNAIDKTNKKHRKDQNQAEQPTDNSGSSIERIQTKKKDQQTDENAASDENGKRRKNAQPVDVKKAKDIAADPSKTTDTVVLPVDNGAAVLDSDKDADNRGADRNRRKQEREERKNVQAPKSDKEAQRGFKDDDRVRIRPVLQDKGERISGFKGYDDYGGRRIGDRDNRVVINIGGRLVIRSDDDTRLARNRQIRYDRLPNNQIREVIVQPNGDRVVTIRNRWGEIVRRSRIINNREVVIFYSPELERGRDRLFLRDPGDDLPPMRLTIPLHDYIIDVSGSGGGSRDYEQFLDEPPVEPVERVYSVDEVKNSARIRDKMRRIDLDTITFDTGSSEIAQDQVQTLQTVGDAIKGIIDKDPGETFLIEGHTDAVGSDESNLVLSDSRAEAVANVLSDAFNIPPENLVTQGYGERYLKVDIDGPERLNRRVTIRRITPLVRPADAEANAE